MKRLYIHEAVEKAMKQGLAIRRAGDDYASIAQRIMERRKELRLTLREVADSSGLTASTLQRYETGFIRSIPVQRLNALARALQTMPGFILGLPISADERLPYMHVGRRWNPLAEDLLADDWVLTAY